MSVNIQTSNGLVKIAGTPTIDTTLSNVSKNPVQNKVVTTKIDEINRNLTSLKISEKSLTNNIIGTDTRIYYYPLKIGDVIKFSKKNDSDSFPPMSSDANLKFIQCDENGTIIDTWQLTDVLLPRKITIAKESNYVKWSYDISDRPLMVNTGETVLPYEPYIPSVKMLAEEVSAQNESLVEQKMLGWNVPEECPIQNEVNENQFIQKVGRVDLGSFSWTLGYGKGKQWAYEELVGFKNLSKLFCDKYTNVQIDGWDGLNDNEISMHPTSSTILHIRDDSYTDATAFKNANKGVYLYYELATPITIQIDGNEAIENLNASLYALSNGTLTNITNGYYYNNGVVSSDSNSSYGIINNLQSGNELCWENANTLTSSSPMLIDFFNGDTYISQSNVSKSSGSITIPSNVTRAILSMPTTSINTIKVTSGVIANIKNDLGGLSFSVNGSTLTITNGTKTWTLT